MFKYLIILFGLVLHMQVGSAQQQGGDRICGKWMAAENNLTVLVYKSGDHFKAKIIWFKDDPGKPMDEWRDAHNPDASLRSRKLLGMEVLNDLKYDAGDDAWNDGTVYDAQHGHTWDASAYIDKKGLLRVRGYWHLKIFGRTMTFKRAS